MEIERLVRRTAASAELEFSHLDVIQDPSRGFVVRIGSENFEELKSLLDRFTFEIEHLGLEARNASKSFGSSVSLSP